jgi:hypothetical protein
VLEQQVCRAPDFDLRYHTVKIGRKRSING